jgi:L-alanine-DL-glutamate epimerase-like enolase superfamily enzyme
MSRTLEVSIEAWPLARPFAISRGVKTKADVVIATITDGDHVGVGECVPYPRYEETVEGVATDIMSLCSEVEEGLDRETLLGILHAGAARNALDNALWDLESKQAGKRAWQLAGIETPTPYVTAETIGIGTLEEMAASAVRLSSAPLIKVKLDGHLVLERMQAVHDNAPDARLIIDPNEGWTIEQLKNYAPRLADMGVEMIEQPVPAGSDGELSGYVLPVPICADEACHTSADIDALIGKYQMINIKLDKTGGLTEALKTAQAATDAGFGIMIGCMVGTSLAMAPAVLLGGYAEFVDLDGPLLLKQDRDNGLTFNDGCVYPPEARLWG